MLKQAFKKPSGHFKSKYWWTRSLSCYSSLYILRKVLESKGTQNIQHRHAIPRTTSKVPSSYVQGTHHTHKGRCLCVQSEGMRTSGWASWRMSLKTSSPLPGSRTRVVTDGKVPSPALKDTATAPPTRIMLQNLQPGRAIPTQVNPSPAYLADLCLLHTVLRAHCPSRS